IVSLDGKSRAAFLTRNHAWRWHYPKQCWFGHYPVTFGLVAGNYWPDNRFPQEFFCRCAGVFS
ncbi:MAG: hypothetical protein NTV55_05430, partial [Planctomycetota bacterium]|nr:hypothetical protein [Planctomycetota bacterium]